MNTMTPECTINNNLPTGEVLFPPCKASNMTTSIDSLDDSLSSVGGLDEILDSGRDVVSINQSNTFESYLEDENVIASNEKQKVLLAACYGVVQGFDITLSPYKEQKQTFFPTIKFLKQELLRRDPHIKKIRGKKHPELVSLLSGTEYKVTDEIDITFITGRELELRTLLEDKEKEKEELAERARGPNITNSDRLRFVEVMLSDDVKTLYRSSQDILTRSGLDSRNSVMRVVDFYDKIVEVFNDKDFLPYSQSLPDLHEDFRDSMELPLKTYRLTREKAKDVVTTVRPKLTHIVNKYELSGAGSGQRSEEDDNYGSVDLTKCIDGDDRQNFIESSSETYLLYWWHKLDVEGFVQFTLCILDKFHSVNATQFNLVSNLRTSPNRKAKDEDSKKDIAAHLGVVGNGILELGKITMEREIENWEDKLFDLEDKLMDLEHDVNHSTQRTKKIQNMKKRISNLENKINNTKKRCVGL